MEKSGMEFYKADKNDFGLIRDFYWDLIDGIEDRQQEVGWIKGVYPSDEMLKEALFKEELYLLIKDDAGNLSEESILAAVILNSDHNEGYEGISWNVDCDHSEVMIPHALGVAADVQGKGVGKRLVNEMIRLARQEGKKAVRLDILGRNHIAEKLYTGAGFEFIEEKLMYYEDTGWTEFRMYEYSL